MQFQYPLFTAYQSVSLDDVHELPSGEIVFNVEALKAVSWLCYTFGLPKRPSTMQELLACIQYTFMFSVFAELDQLEKFKACFPELTPAWFAYVKREPDRLATIHRTLRLTEKLAARMKNGQLQTGRMG